MKAAFESSRTFGLFTAYFDAELYHHAASYYDSHVFARNRPLYAVVGVASVLEAVEISQHNHQPYQDMKRFLEQDFAITNDSINKAFDNFKMHFTARIDVKLMKTTGDFQVLSTSDDKANVIKPDWFQKGGIGYTITSCVGKLNFVTKATEDGEIFLYLRGQYVINPEDKSKLIPYWIDYTKLTVNGRNVFDKRTPTWHNIPYIYNVAVKAGEEVAVQVEWLPHTTHEEEIKPKEEFGKLPSGYSILPNSLSVAQNNEKKAPSNDIQVISQFSRYFTARVDVKLMSTEGDFQILSTSDDKAKTNKPKWFQKNGVGYVIESYVGKLEFTAKSTVDGQISLNLRGLAVRNPEDKSKRVPYWVDYTKLTVNGKEIFNELTPVWHDKPYRHNINVKAGEEIKIQVEWLPHRSDT